VTCHGQVIGAILADTKSHAQRAAKTVKVTYEELEPIITISVHNIYKKIANNLFNVVYATEKNCKKLKVYARTYPLAYTLNL